MNSIHLLDDSLNFTSDNIGLDSSTQGAGACGSLTMKLGDITLGFNQGNWAVGKSILARSFKQRDYCS